MNLELLNGASHRCSKAHELLTSVCLGFIIAALLQLLSSFIKRIQLGTAELRHRCCDIGSLLSNSLREFSGATLLRHQFMLLFKRIALLVQIVGLCNIFIGKKGSILISLLAGEWRRRNQLPYFLTRRLELSLTLK